MKHKIAKTLITLGAITSLNCFAANGLECNVIVPQDSGNYKFKEMDSEDPVAYQSFHRLEFRLKELPSGRIVFESPSDEQMKAEVADLTASVQKRMSELPYSLLPESANRKLLYSQMSEAMEEYKKAFILLSAALEFPTNGPDHEQSIRYIIASLNDRMALAGLKTDKQQVLLSLNTLAPVTAEVPYKKVDGTYGMTDISIVCKAVSR